MARGKKNRRIHHKNTKEHIERQIYRLELEIASSIDRPCPYCNSSDIETKELDYAGLVDILYSSIKPLWSEHRMDQLQELLVKEKLRAVEFGCKSCKSMGAMIYDKETAKPSFICKY